MSRHDPLLPNMLIVARREYAARVRSRLFALSTLLLAGLAMLVALDAQTQQPPPSRLAFAQNRSADVGLGGRAAARAFLRAAA